jgi:lauroyl/myristoyl acyltransferase
MLQRLLFGARRQIFRRLNNLIGDSTNEVRDFSRHLLGRFTVPWRVNALSRCGDESFRSWVRIENEAVLTELKAAGKPALLVNCHTAIGRVVPLVVMRLGHATATLEPESYLQRMGVRGAARIQSITLRGEGEKFWMKEMFQAKKVLDAKGIVHLAMDGHQGIGGVARAFLGRKRIFQVGLAKLAIEMGVPIVLVNATLDEDGHVHINFRGPLDLGDASLPDDARLDLFLDYYVSMIETIWRTDLGNVSPRHLPPYLRSELISDMAVRTVTPA